MKKLLDYVTGCIFNAINIASPVEEEEDMSDVIDDKNLLRMYRTYHEKGTHTRIVFPDGDEFACLERKYVDNQKFVSCVPEDIYPIVYRESEVVERTSKGKYKKGFEISDVTGRDYIMFHVGNYIQDSEGCPLVGTTHAFIDNDVPVVWQSRVAFIEFMEKMLELMGTENEITHVSIEEESE